MTISALDMESALAALGVKEDTLSVEEKRALDEDGYLILGQLLNRDDCVTMAHRLDELAEIEGDKAGSDFHTEPAAVRLGALVNKDPMFDVCFLHPKILAAINYITAGNFGLSSITSRTALPGDGHQAFHWDDGARSANGLWFLEDYTVENGATRVVPGSHLFPISPWDIEDPSAAHSDEVIVVQPAGTAVVINSRLWHSGRQNSSNGNRHLISAFFTPRGGYQSFAYRKLNIDSQNRLSDAARYVIDHDIE